MASGSAWARSWGDAWGNSWGVVADHTLVDTDILQRPVNVVLAGMQPIKDRYREWDVRAPNLRTETKGTASSTRRLKGGRPSFTTKTGPKGYD